jgi:transglutaminase-like putative cysteine protease
MASTPGSAQSIQNEEITPQPLEIREDFLGNRVGRFSLENIAVGGKLVIRHEYALVFGVAAASHPAAAPLPEHLQPEPKVEADAPQITRLARELSEGVTDPHELAIKIERHTRSLITYDPQSSTRNQGALAALGSGSGVCEEYACLFTAIARAAGLPARVVHGFARDRDSTRSAWTGIAGTSIALAAYRHAWAEVYLAGQGWAAVDPAYQRSDLDAPELKELAPGTYIVEGYANNAVIGRYVGGRLQGQRKETLSW